MDFIYSKMFLLILLCSVHVCVSRHVLVVFSLPEKSHSVLGDSLVNTLLDADYEVTYVTPYLKEPRPNLTYVDVSTVLDQIHDRESYLPEDTVSPRYLPLLGSRFAVRVLNHPEMKELMLNSTLNFDAVLVEWYYTSLLAPLASLFECPLIWYSPMDVSWQSLSLVTHTPARRLDLPPTSLADRVHQMWSQIYLLLWNYFYISRIEIPVYENSYREAFEERRRLLPNFEAVASDGALLLLNSHPRLGPAVSLPGNVKYIGGHHISDRKPSPPKNLKKLLDSSAAGVIYVNLETSLISSNLQDNIARDLQDVFGELQQTVIWKYDDILVNLPQNVYTLKNPPQHAILNHANTIAFINHGDMFSILDATHYGVPVIALPTLEDQEANVNLMVRRGCGVSMRTTNLASEIKKSVRAILNNSSYLTNARKVKATFYHRLIPPQKEFTHWVETVIRTHGVPHLRSSSLQISFLERNNVDVILLILLMFWFFTKVYKVVRVHLVPDDPNEGREKED